MSGSTIRSLSFPTVLIPPTLPSQYLSYLIVTTLQRAGFDGAEAGALAEMERLLEHHVQRLFEGAKEYADLSGRPQPVLADLHAAHQEAASGSGSNKRLRRESKRRRNPIPLEKAEQPPSPPREITLDLLPDRSTIQEDTKPDISSSGLMQIQTRTQSRRGEVPPYAPEWAPGLPGKWTYAFLDPDEETPPDAPVQVTAASLDFVKATASGGDIPPELGIVHYRPPGKRRK
ncbi:hypothetical protein EHS25_001491 [Saitozyma podzolica]|uniref:Bromodomain associated domain-containing protein n=1 Tax=Saitozyma podzolica TaxID=1890683 RepID=A0A427YGL9_9TREE|nr:hypothetical protein EHS25_001491 [Saitozyma podzolica]